MLGIWSDAFLLHPPAGIPVVLTLESKNTALFTLNHFLIHCLPESLKVDYVLKLYLASTIAYAPKKSYTKS